MIINFGLDYIINLPVQDSCRCKNLKKKNNRMNFWRHTAIYLGNTVGQFIPWTCSRGHTNKVSSYGGNIVDGYSCPTCKAINLKQSRQEQIRRKELKRKEDQHREQLNRKQRELNAKQEENRKLLKEALTDKKMLSQSHFTNAFFQDFLIGKIKLENAQINEGVFQMSVFNYDKKFQILPESLTNEEYKEQRIKNPKVIYGKVQFQAFPRTEAKAKKSLNDNPNLEISFPLTEQKKQMMQNPNLRAQSNDLKNVFAMASQMIF